jgi:hypothetical protein
MIYWRFATSVGEKSLVPLGIPGFDAIIMLGFTIQNGDSID